MGNPRNVANTTLPVRYQSPEVKHILKARQATGKVFWWHVLLLQLPVQKAQFYPQPAASWHYRKQHIIPSETESSSERGKGPPGALDIASVTPERASDEVKNNFCVVYKKSPFLRSICLNQLSFLPAADELIKLTSCIKSGR